MAVSSAQLKIYRLASESELSDGSESMCSLQNHETDIIQDTPDTDTKSESSGSEYSQFEFEIASSDEQSQVNRVESSATDEDLITAGTIAAVLCDSSIGSWLTEVEEGSDSSFHDTGSKRTDYWACVQCKTTNNNPLFRFCQKCFQERKQSYPPRPRKRRYSKTLATDKIPSSSQDSGIASFSECNQRTKASDWDSKVKTRVRRKTATSVDLSDDMSEKNNININIKSPKRKMPLCDTEVDAKKIKLDDKMGPLPEIKELCLCCNKAIRNGIFIHGKTAHMCFCYTCSKKTLKLTHRCPICNRRVGNVVKVFTS